MGPSHKSSITVFFPAFNDATTIGDLVREVRSTSSELTEDFEVIVVNDGSLDGTADRLVELARTIPELRVVTHETNQGYGAALRSGFAAATKDLVFYTDGDGQYNVRELRELFNAMTDETDVVNGYKLNRADGALRRILGTLYARTTRRLFELPIRDVDCDFRLIRKRSLSAIELTTSSGAICVELVDQLSRSGARFTEIGVSHYPRQAGRSQFFSPGRIMLTFVDLASLWLRRKIGTVISGQKEKPLDQLSGTGK